jgi:hypothetical protein
MLTQDTTRPELISFDLDMDSALLDLTFSETIELSEFDVSSLYLYGGNATTEDKDLYNCSDLCNSTSCLIGCNSTAQPLLQCALNCNDSDCIRGCSFREENFAVYRFTNDTQLSQSPSSEYDTIIHLVIGNDDLDRIKMRVPLLASDEQTVFLSISGDEFSTEFDDVLPTGVFDKWNNAVTSKANLQVTKFTKDTTAPRLESFAVDLHDGLITFHFSEAMDRYVNGTAITIQNAEFNSTQQHSLEISPSNTSLLIT